MSDREIGDQCRLSNLRLGDLGTLEKRKFVVIHRVTEDRTSGYTTVLWEDCNDSEIFIWDERDPLVTLLGKYRIKVDWKE